MILTFFNGKAKYDKMLEHMISWKVLKNCTPKSANDDLGLTLSFYGKVKVAFWAFIWKDLMDFVEGLVQQLINTVK